MDIIERIKLTERLTDDEKSDLVIICEKHQTKQLRLLASAMPISCNLCWENIVEQKKQKIKQVEKLYEQKLYQYIQSIKEKHQVDFPNAEKLKLEILDRPKPSSSKFLEFFCAICGRYEFPFPLNEKSVKKLNELTQQDGHEHRVLRIIKYETLED